jgi:hypothetical protein
MLGKAVGNSFISHEAANFGEWTIIIETLRSLGHAAPLMVTLLLIFGALFILVSIFVSGGVYGILVSEEGSSYRNLLHLSAENFFKMLKVFFINLVNWIVVAIFSGLLAFIFSAIFEATYNESLVWPFIYIWVIVTGLLAVFAIAAYDFSRIIRLRDERNFVYSYKKGMMALFANKLNVLALFFVFAAITVFSHLLLSVFLNQLGDLLHVLLIFLVFQGFIWFRYYIKTLIMNAEVHLVFV